MKTQRSCRYRHSFCHYRSCKNYEWRIAQYDEFDDYVWYGDKTNTLRIDPANIPKRNGKEVRYVGAFTNWHGNVFDIREHKIIEDKNNEFTSKYIGTHIYPFTYDSPTYSNGYWEGNICVFKGNGNGSEYGWVCFCVYE